MISLPRKCGFCGKRLMHYGSCNCADARLGEIDTERRALHARLARLDQLECEVLGLKGDDGADPIEPQVPVSQANEPSKPEEVKPNE